MRILPATRKMLNALREGKPIDLKLGERAKARTIHNTYMTVPLIFLMISNHFPTATYGQSYNWLILSALVLAGAISAHYIYKPRKICAPELVISPSNPILFFEPLQKLLHPPPPSSFLVLPP